MTTEDGGAQVVPSALELGEIIRSTRTAHGLTQAQLAQDAGVGRQWLVAVEAGQRPGAPMDMVLRLLSRLEIMLVLVPVGAGDEPE